MTGRAAGDPSALLRAGGAPALQEAEGAQVGNASGIPFGSQRHSERDLCHREKGGGGWNPRPTGGGLAPALRQHATEAGKRDRKTSLPGSEKRSRKSRKDKDDERDSEC